MMEWIARYFPVIAGSAVVAVLTVGGWVVGDIISDQAETNQELHEVNQELHRINSALEQTQTDRARALCESQNELRVAMGLILDAAEESADDTPAEAERRRSFRALVEQHVQPQDCGDLTDD